MVPKISTKSGAKAKGKQCRVKRMAVVERSPEKAGLGGSTPSLATILTPLFATII
jgi:hypothetical protein